MKSWPIDSLTETAWGTVSVNVPGEDFKKPWLLVSMLLMWWLQTQQTHAVFEMWLSRSGRGKKCGWKQDLCLQFYNVAMTVEPTCTRRDKQVRRLPSCPQLTFWFAYKGFLHQWPHSIYRNGCHAVQNGNDAIHLQCEYCVFTSLTAQTLGAHVHELIVQNFFMSCLQNTCKQASKHQAEKTGIEQALARRHQTMTNLWEGPGNKSGEGFNLLIAQSVPNLHVYRAADEWKQSTGPNLIQPAEAKTSCQSRRAPRPPEIHTSFLSLLSYGMRLLYTYAGPETLTWKCCGLVLTFGWLIWKDLYPCFKENKQSKTNNKSEIKCQPFWAAKCKSSESPCRELIMQRGENHTCRTGQASRPGYTDPPLYVECPLLPTAFLNCWPPPLITCSSLNPCPWLRLPPCLLSVRFICG